MITRNSPEFYSRMQRYVYVHPDDDINNLEELRYEIVDVEDVETIGCPMDSEDGTEYEIYAILEPGEDFPIDLPSS